MASQRKAVDELLGGVPKARADMPPVQGSSPAERLDSNSCLDDSSHSSIPHTNRERASRDHVYRVRGLPSGINRQQTLDVVSTLLELEGSTSIPEIRSFATNHDGLSKVATLSFGIVPANLSAADVRHEWSFDITDSLAKLRLENKENEHIRRRHKLTIDDHFHGPTVLSSPLPQDHKVDCLALSGLGGHAFGSFKEKDGSHMWLCDDLPDDLTTTRIMIYGYDSRLHGSESFQGLEALGTTLRNTLCRIYKKETKPLFFIAHSLGGLIVKEAIIQMSKSSNRDLDILHSVYGVLFFGVPNQGMDITSLVPMVENQPNQSVLHSLGTESDLLRRQTRDFPEAFPFKDSKIMCFYETCTSPTATKKSNKWTMEGPRKTLVGSASATHGRSWENLPHHILAIDRDHSQLVKFKANDDVYDLVLGIVEDFTDGACTLKRCRGIQAEELTAQDKDCLKSLAFPEMGYREHEVQDTLRNSCSWVFEHQVYRRWIGDQHGILWIKGKPGSGKSTLVKQIYKNGATHSDVQLAFFFHRRGVQLQQTFEGMLRTLMHQLISQSASALVEFRSLYNEKEVFGNHGKHWNWYIPELRQALKFALLATSESHTVSISIDALDEAGEEPAKEIVDYIYELNKILQISARQTRICFSCRHYPIVCDNIGFEICMETENQEDISNCIEQILSRGIEAHKRHSGADDIKNIQSQLVSSADGVFLWAILMVARVVNEYNKGKSLSQVLGILKRTPPDLYSIYEHIFKMLKDDEDRADSVHLMQWVCLAEKPLSPTRLRYALALDDSVTHIHKFQQSIQESEGFVEDDGRMEQQIVSLSGGLIEVRHHHNSKIVQFIHQSVNDFLLNGGFRWLGLDCKLDFFGQGHHRLARSCINYLKLGEIQEMKHGLSPQYKVTRPPFLKYAVTSWFLHAEIAESRGIPQKDIIERFEWPHASYFKDWIDLFHKIDEYHFRCPQLSTTLLHFSAASGLCSLLQELLASGTDLEEEDAKGNRALHFAAQFGHGKIVRTLLEENADLQAQNRDGNTALERAASGGQTIILELLLDNGVDVNCDTHGSGTALLSAVSARSYKATKLLLDRGANVHAQGGRYGNALRTAQFYKNKSIIQLLLNRGANVNTQGGHYGNALQTAILGEESTLQLILDKGADINARGGHYGNALQAAACCGKESIIQLLLDRGADINAQGGYYTNTLQAAVFYGKESIIQLLVDRGADINAQRRYYGTALQAAVFCKKESIVQLLLDKGADINAQGGYYGNALQTAICLGEKSIVRLLLDRKADINTQCGKYGNSLQAAVYLGKEYIIQLLLDRGAEPFRKDKQGRSLLQMALRGNHDKVINIVLAHLESPDWTYRDRQGCSALHFASSGGSYLILKMILDSGVEIDLSDTYGWTALHWACRNGGPKSVQMLIDSGADSNRKDVKGWTPLDVAIFCQNDHLISLLQEKSKQTEHHRPSTRHGRREIHKCSSCYHVFYGTYYQCEECDVYYLCFRCILDVDRIHKQGHRFVCIE